MRRARATGDKPAPQAVNGATLRASCVSFSTAGGLLCVEHMLEVTWVQKRGRPICACLKIEEPRMPLFCVEYMLPRVATRKGKKLEEPQYRSRGAPIFGVPQFSDNHKRVFPFSVATRKHVLNTDLLLRMKVTRCPPKWAWPSGSLRLASGGPKFSKVRAKAGFDSSRYPFFRWGLKRSQKESYHFEDPESFDRSRYPVF